MKSFFYMGRNEENVSRVSWKIWKIECKGNRVVTQWGPVSLVRRKPVPKATLQSKEWHFRTPAAARDYEQKQIRRKLAKGYERSPRRRARFNDLAPYGLFME